MSFTAKAELRGKFMALNARIEKRKGFKAVISVSTLRKLEEEKQTKSKASRRKEMIKSRSR